jgi:hypothetical protein
MAEIVGHQGEEELAYRLGHERDLRSAKLGFNSLNRIIIKRRVNIVLKSTKKGARIMGIGGGNLTPLFL